MISPSNKTTQSDMNITSLFNNDINNNSNFILTDTDLSSLYLRNDTQPNEKSELVVNNKEKIKQLRKEKYKVKNKESARRYREKHKREVNNLIRKNQQLIKENNFLRRQLMNCPHCRNILLNSNSNKDKFIVNSNQNIVSSNKKKVIFLTSVIALFSLFLGLICPSMVIRQTKKMIIGRKLFVFKEDFRNQYLLYLSNYVPQKQFYNGPAILFGDYYKLAFQKSFLNDNYKIYQYRQTRFIEDNSFFQGYGTPTCDDCMVRINRENIKKSDENPLQFSIFVPLTNQSKFWEYADEAYINTTNLSYLELNCQVIGYSKNKRVVNLDQL